MELLQRPPEPDSDGRLYVPDQDGWRAHIKQTWDREYCFLKNPNEDFFHLLQCGEIYLERDKEMYCLNCALRLGLATRDRLFWQHNPHQKQNMPL
jgi:hypothetical protein